MKKLQISSRGVEHVILNRQAMDTLGFNNENSGNIGTQPSITTRRSPEGWASVFIMWRTEMIVG